MFKILSTQPDYFQAVADAFKVLATYTDQHGAAK
jgi:hypothetical protein